MSDFLRGVGTGLAGSRGIARAVNNFALAPYIAAIKEQQARSDAAVAELRGTQAELERRRLGVFNGVLDGTVDPTKGAQASYAIAGKAPYGNGNVPGVSTNYQTGDMKVGDPSVYGAYLAKALAEQKRLQAQANSANALAGRHRAETGLVPYRKQKLEAETGRTKNPGHYSRGNVGRSGGRPYGGNERLIDTPHGRFTVSEIRQAATEAITKGTNEGVAKRQFKKWTGEDY